jgi:hypothetical protein
MNYLLIIDKKIEPLFYILILHNNCNYGVSPIEHYVNIRAICEEIAHIKQQRLQYKKSMTKEERRECKAYRRRFENEYINPTLAEERLKAFAADCYEPVNLRDNGIIQTEWRATYMPPADVPISYE